MKGKCAETIENLQIIYDNKQGKLDVNKKITNRRWELKIKTLQTGGLY
jgi:hypothetical protein